MKMYIEEFNDYLVNIKKSSKNTIESYLRDISQFCVFCVDSEISSVKNISSVTIGDYISHMQKSGKSYATLVRILASIKCYFNFLFLSNIISKFSFDDIKIKKQQKKLPEVLTSKEIRLLLDQPDVNDLKGCRDKAMLELLYATGIKVSELIAVNVNDLNLQVGILHLHNVKNDRVIPMYPECIKYLLNYMTRVRNLVVTDDSVEELFTNMNGEKMTRQGFWKIIKHYSEMAGIKKDITPHTIRHSFAAHLIENGAPIKDIKEILGHSDISSTQIYAQLMKNKYAQSYKKYHPMAR